MSPTFDVTEFRGSNPVLGLDASCKPLVEDCLASVAQNRGGLVTPSHLPNGGLRAFACLSSEGPGILTIITYDRNVEPLKCCVSRLLVSASRTRCMDKRMTKQGAFVTQMGFPVKWERSVSSASTPSLYFRSTCLAVSRMLGMPNHRIVSLSRELIIYYRNALCIIEN